MTFYNPELTYSLLVANGNTNVVKVVKGSRKNKYRISAIGRLRNASVFDMIFWGDFDSFSQFKVTGVKTQLEFTS